MYKSKQEAKVVAIKSVVERFGLTISWSEKNIRDLKQIPKVSPEGEYDIWDRSEAGLILSQIEALHSQIDSKAVPMAVVDYMGFYVPDACEVIDEESLPIHRFGIRDMRHVSIYGFAAVKLNKAAIEAQS